MMKENKGITLVALVITIIVLLILAGVTLSMVVGQNGIFTKANNAKEETAKTDLKDTVAMAIMEVQSDMNDPSTTYTYASTATDFNTQVTAKIDTTAGVTSTADDTNKTITYTKGNYKVVVTCVPMSGTDARIYTATVADAVAK